MEGDFTMQKCKNNCGYTQAGKNENNQGLQNNTVQENAGKNDHAPFIGFPDSADPDTFLFGMLERVASN